MYETSLRSLIPLLCSGRVIQYLLGNIIPNSITAQMNTIYSRKNQNAKNMKFKLSIQP